MNAKPTLLMNRKIKKAGKPEKQTPMNSITYKRCGDCDHKWMIEEDGKECPKCATQVEPPAPPSSKTKTKSNKK